MPPSSTLLRAALALTATGIVSAASIRHVQEESGADVMFAVAYAFCLSLILIATPLGMLFAVLIDRGIRGSRIYQSVLFLPVMLSLALIGINFSLMLE